MKSHVSLWSLSRLLRTYPDLLLALAKFHGVPVVVRGRARSVTVEDGEVLADLLSTRRARPKVASMLGLSRRRPKKRPEVGPRVFRG
jgi:hypothetical protein